MMQTNKVATGKSLVPSLRHFAASRARHGLRFGKRLAIRTRTELARIRVPGMLSIVVPVYNVERYLAQCIESLLQQEYVNLQLIIVDDGSPDQSFEVARRYARRDPRIKLIRQQNAGPSAARNVGVQHARGEFLTFFDSDDFVDRHVYRDAIDSLQRSGSDLAVLAYRRERNGSLEPAAPWIRAAHAQDREGVTLRDFPEIMVNTIATSKVYRRDFWDAQELEFPEGLLFEDQALTMLAFTAARGIDVRSYVGINWRIREGSTTQNAYSPRNLEHHHVAVQRSLEILEQRGFASAHDLRIVQLMNNNFGDYLRNIGLMEGESWTQFLVAVKYLTDRVTPTMARHIEARKKVLFALCLADQRELALEFLQQGGWERDSFPGQVAGDQLIAELPLHREIEPFVTPDDLLFSVEETELEAVLRGVRLEGATVAVELFAHINHLRMDTEEIQLSATLHSSGGRVEPVAIERRHDPVAALGHTRRYADMATGAATVKLPHDLFHKSDSFHIQVTIESGALRRTGTVKVDSRTVFAPALPLGESGRIFAFEGRDGSTAQLRIETPEIRALELEVNGAHLEVTLETVLTGEQDVVLVGRKSGQVEASGLLTASGTHMSENPASTVLTGTLEVPATLGGPTEYLLGVRTADAGIVYPADTRNDRWRLLHDETSEAQLHVAPQLHARGERSGRILVVDLRGGALVVDVQLRDESLRLELQLPAGSPRIVGATAASGTRRHDASVAQLENQITVDLPLLESRWGQEATALRPGLYSLTLLGQGSIELPSYLSGHIVARFPNVQYGSLLRQTVLRSSDGLFVSSLQPPIAPEEQGAGNQLRMRDEFRTLNPTGPRSVLFRNLYGEAANDSALAVHRELKRRDSDLELIWAVKDHSVSVPTDATVVLEETRAYYRAIGTAEYVMVNVHQPDWYVKPERQVLIETFHGYPFKLNGKSWWAKVGFDAVRQESLLRRAQDWDYLVSPAHYATDCLLEFYRDKEDVPGQILEIGYPRNDALIGDGAESRRRAARDRLGISDDVNVILYAPTFRDYLSADDFTAELVTFLDVARLAHELGSSYKVLLRGHPFNARTGTSADGTVIDVTEYPDINDLILASDMAILDYSSLRFDYALTGKPVFYFVPDEEQYFDGRGSLVPYSETTPGPHVREFEELVGLLRRAPEIGARYESDRRDFIRKFMELEDGHATSRLVDTVFFPRGDAGLSESENN